MTRARSPRQYTLPELAAAAGMTVRNVRSYQTRGLIPIPQRRGRHSVYSDEHLRRLRQIRDARARGASLSLISTHIAQGGSLDASGIDPPWLPLAGGIASTPRRRAPRTTVPLDAILSTSTVPAHVVQTIDLLVSQGVLYRKGDQVHAERSLAVGLAGAVAHGVSVDRVLDVLAAAAGAGRSIGTALESALSNGHGRNISRQQLLDLVARTLSTVVRG